METLVIINISDDSKEYRFILYIRYGYKRKIIYKDEYCKDKEVHSKVKYMGLGYRSELDTSDAFKSCYSEYNTETDISIPLYYVQDSGRVISDEEFLSICDSMYGIIPLSNTDIEAVIHDKFHDSIIMIYPCNFTPKATTFFIDNNPSVCKSFIEELYEEFSIHSSEFNDIDLSI